MGGEESTEAFFGSVRPPVAFAHKKGSPYVDDPFLWEKMDVSLKPQGVVALSPSLP